MDDGEGDDNEGGDEVDGEESGKGGVVDCESSSNPFY